MLFRSGKICRKVARRKAEAKRKIQPVKVTADNVTDFLRVPKIHIEKAPDKDAIGTVTGLAWTATGGEILIIEALRTRGKGKLQLTGQLGEVMQESAQAAFTFAKSRFAKLGIEEDVLDKYDIHIHLPEGAIPKDGPSAGIGMATALVSVLAERPVRHQIAMTGEITLRGNVLPIGGVKEKLLAASRARIMTVILPAANERDLVDLPQEVHDDLKFIFVDNVLDVFDAALRPAPKRANTARSADSKYRN